LLIRVLNSQTIRVHFWKLFKSLEELNYHLKTVESLESETKNWSSTLKALLHKLYWLIFQAKLKQSLISNQEVLFISSYSKIDGFQLEDDFEIKLSQSFVSFSYILKKSNFLLLLLFKNLAFRNSFLFLFFAFIEKLLNWFITYWFLGRRHN
jgi:hypothetical protein